MSTPPAGQPCEKNHSATVDGDGDFIISEMNRRRAREIGRLSTERRNKGKEREGMSRKKSRGRKKRNKEGDKMRCITFGDNNIRWNTPSSHSSKKRYAALWFIDPWDVQLLIHTFS